MDSTASNKKGERGAPPAVDLLDVRLAFYPLHLVHDLAHAIARDVLKVIFESEPNSRHWVSGGITPSPSAGTDLRLKKAISVPNMISQQLMPREAVSDGITEQQWTGFESLFRPGCPRPCTCLVGFIASANEKSN